MRLVVNRIQPPPAYQTNEPGIVTYTIGGTITDTNVKWFHLASPEAFTLTTVGPGTTGGEEYRFIKTNGHWFLNGQSMWTTVF